MGRNIILVVVLSVTFYGGFRWYQQHQQTTRVTNGEFTCQGCDSPEEHARFLKENAGETADGNFEHKSTSARVAAADAEAGGVAPYEAAAAGGPLTGTAPSTPAPVVVPTTVEPGATPAGVEAQVQPSLPATDTQPAAAPNGTRFAGSGSFLVYRQGNITYRLDTSTGRSCVIYATMDEWRKQIVMSHGCGRTA